MTTESEIRPRISDVDLEKLRQLDCGEVVARDMGMPRQRGRTQHGKYGQYKCPFHNDRTPSLTVWAAGWRCYGCGKSGDAITWVQAYHGMSFVAAAEYLGGATMQLPARKSEPVARAAAEPPSAAWQTNGLELVNWAFDRLWSDEGARARAYLCERRGLDEQTISMALMGYVPGGPDEWRTVAGMRVPCGIVIPWLAEGHLWQVKIRRAAGKPKYLGVSGGCASGMYAIDQIDPYGTVMLVEGEIDALTVNQERVGIHAVALGMAVKAFDVQWMQRLLWAQRIYARLDRNAAGVAGVARLMEVSRRVTSVQVDDPYDDCNDYSVRDRAGFRNWLINLL